MTVISLSYRMIPPITERLLSMQSDAGLLSVSFKGIVCVSILYGTDGDV